MARTPTWSAAEREQVLDELSASGLSVAEFARCRQIPAYRLYWAKRRSQSGSDSRLGADVHSEFEQVSITDGPQTHGSSIDLLLRSGMSIRVTRDFDEVTLRRLIGFLSPC